MKCREFTAAAAALLVSPFRRRPALIADDRGASETIDDAITDFAVDYADQTHKDHRAFVKAIRQGRIEVAPEG